MTDTLAYISGSLVITAEDINGNVTTLQQGIDYTVTYDGTGNQTDENGKEVHVLDIVILQPQPVMYTLDYDTTLIIPDQVTESVKYANSATITLWGEDITDNSTEKVYADINISSKSFKVELCKTSSLTGEPLGGATFGLYNPDGGLITSGVTNDKGQLLFQTNIIEGIILREHVLYYMQELRAPPGYQLDDTKFWFCFCDKTTDHCDTCEKVIAEKDAYRIPFEQIGKVNVSNMLADYDLPATGGAGIYPLILVSVLFIAIPLVYIFIRRRKRERRGVG
jgi:LPXTG-motif cell wall-anchored protein